MKLACQESMVPGKSLRERVQKLAAWSYEGLELWGRDLKDRVKEIQQAVKGTSVKVSTVCVGYRGGLLEAEKSQRDMAVSDIPELLSVIADLGAVGLVLVPVFGQPRLPDLSPYKTARQLEDSLLLLLLEELGRHAEKTRTCILLEPLNRYEAHYLNRLDQAVALCKKLGNPYIKIMADFFHMSIEEADVPASIRKAGKWIAHVHLADSNRLQPGKGHTDFKSGFEALQKIGFTNYMALECGIAGDPDVELKKTAEYLRAQM